MHKGFLRGGYFQIYQQNSTINLKMVQFVTIGDLTFMDTLYSVQCSEKYTSTKLSIQTFKVCS